MSEPTPKLEMTEPCYECCGILYLQSEGDDSCIVCDSLLDWEGIEDNWNYGEPYSGEVVGPDALVDPDVLAVLERWAGKQKDLWEDVAPHKYESDDYYSLGFQAEPPKKGRVPKQVQVTNPYYFEISTTLFGDLP